MTRCIDSIGILGEEMYVWIWGERNTKGSPVTRKIIILFGGTSRLSVIGRAGRRDKQEGQNSDNLVSGIREYRGDG